MTGRPTPEGQEASLASAPPFAALASYPAGVIGREQNPGVMGREGVCRNPGVMGREGVQKPEESVPKVYSDPVPGKPFASQKPFEWPLPGRVPLEGQLGRGPAATSSRGTSTARGCRRRCLGSGLRSSLGVLLGVL